MTGPSSPLATVTVPGLIQLGGDFAPSTSTATVPLIGSIGGPTPIVITPSELQWPPTTASPILDQAPALTDTPTQRLLVRAQNAFTSATSNTGGGILSLRGGDATSAGATGKRGAVRIELGNVRQVMVEATEVATNQRVVSLAQAGSGVGTLNVPANGGDGVIFLSNDHTDATSGTNPSGGSILFVSAGATKIMGTSGTITTIAPA